MIAAPLAALWAVFATALALAAPPPVALDAADEARLAQGEVVVHADEAGDGFTEAAVDVAAPPSAVLDAVLDFEARPGEVGGLRAATVYLREGARAGVRWELSVAGVAVAFHTLYETDRAGVWTAYRLDPTRPNDLADAEGSYQVLAHGSGSRLLYRARATGSRAVPAWVRDMLAQRSARAMLGGMRARAEAAARR